MYLKSDQKKHQKIPTYGAAPYLFITMLVLNLTGLLLSQSVLQSRLLKGGFKDLFYLIGFLLMVVAARLSGIGITLTLHNMWLLILIPIQWVLLTVVIRINDEKWVYELHGEAYKDYCARVNRWIPIKKIK